MPVVYSDARQDHSPGAIDFGELKMAVDERRLYLSLEIGVNEINMQENNRIAMYIDADHNTATGASFNGIGAELEWRFGERLGVFWQDGGFTQIIHSAVSLVTSPTVSSTRFEIALDLEATPDGLNPLFTSDSIRIAFTEKTSAGDFLPESGETLTYTFDKTLAPNVTPKTLAKFKTDDLRILSWNVEFDGLFDPAPERRGAFSRILRAVRPDVIGFQEIYNASAEDVLLLMQAVLPLSEDQRWYAAKQGPDNIVAARFPITKSIATTGNGAFLLNLRPEFDSDLFLIVAHPPCCGNDTGRQFEIDAMMALIRDAKQGKHDVIDLPAQTPIVIVGDFNLVGQSQQLTSLLTGEIINPEFGASFSPDWDDSDFEMLLPRHVASRMFFTWFRETSSFSPGKLDFIIYSGSVFEPQNSYTLFTRDLPNDTLSVYLLNPEDATIASDHLPVIGDFRLRTTTSVQDQSFAPREFDLSVANYPNPFNAGTTFTFTLPKEEFVSLDVFSIAGKLISTVVKGSFQSGEHSVNWSGVDRNGAVLSSGVYFYRLLAGGSRRTQKLILLR